MFSYKRLVAQLNKTIKTLPSERELQTIIDHIEKIRSDMLAIRTALENLPTNESSEDLLKHAENIQSLIASINQKKIRQTKDGNTSAKIYKEIDLPKAKTDLEAMGSLSSIQLIELLSDGDKYPIIRLRGIIAALGLKIPSKTSKKYMINLISTKIPNYRGYKRLREGEPDEHL
jgi:hypothetical protein